MKNLKSILLAASLGALCIQANAMDIKPKVQSLKPHIQNHFVSTSTKFDQNKIVSTFESSLNAAQNDIKENYNIMIIEENNQRYVKVHEINTGVMYELKTNDVSETASLLMYTEGNAKLQTELPYTKAMYLSLIAMNTPSQQSVVEPNVIDLRMPPPGENLVELQPNVFNSGQVQINEPLPPMSGNTVELEPTKFYLESERVDQLMPHVDLTATEIEPTMF